MKPEERRLLLAIARRSGDRSVRDIAQSMGSYKQNLYYLSKWARKSWYDYGVALDLGWLTDVGIVAVMTAETSESER